MRSVAAPGKGRLPSVQRLARSSAVSALVAVSVTLAAHTAGAQAGSIAGTVRDSTGAPVIGAQISLAGDARTIETDGQGRFRLPSVAPGSKALRVRRIGFRPATETVVLDAGARAEVGIVLARVIPTLEPVTVTGRRRSSGEFGGFYDRLDIGHGYYVGREEIDRRRPQRTTDLLRRIPSVRMSHDNFGRTSMRLRAARCPPLIWLNGAPAAAGFFDPDHLDPAMIEGIEVYSGPSTVPAQFRIYPDYGSCGAILVWFRSDRPAPRDNGERLAPARLAELAERGAIYTASEVNSPAIPLDSLGVRATYPDSLFKAGITGQVVAEFVVDTTGDVEPGTIGVVSSTHPLFTRAVVRGLRLTQFRPALNAAGQRVRQIVHLPVRFDLAKRGDRSDDAAGH